MPRFGFTKRRHSRKKDPTLRKAELFRKSDGEAGKKQLRTFIT